MPPSKAFGPDWIVDYFAMVDGRDLDEFLTWYADDANFRFANQPRATGKQAIREALEQFYALITEMRHERTGLWADADSGAFEAIAHFQTKSGRSLALPAVSTLRVRNGLIHDFRFVMDAAPILEDAA
jgi:ketosteroid isomerase-like protein